MSARTATILFIVLSVVPLAAKNKKKVVLPDYVLRAETVQVVIDPNAGEPVRDPFANRKARENVEAALTKWGRFRLVLEGQSADLIFVVRKGHASGPAVRNMPTDNRPVIIQPNAGDVRVAAQQGHAPGLQNPGLGPPDTSPRVDNEIGPSEDILALYQGRVDYPLDAPAVWRYLGKDALEGPQVKAVEQFKQAITEAEKQQQQRH